jgi:hypothetical protein
MDDLDAMNKMQVVLFNSNKLIRKLHARARINLSNNLGQIVLDGHSIAQPEKTDPTGSGFLIDRPFHPVTVPS